MSTQFLLDAEDLQELANLMVLMIETQESRKQICRSFGIDPHNVSFIIGTTDAEFCTELIDRLNRYGYQENICKLCCQGLFPILDKSAYGHRRSILEKIVEKLNCNCNHYKQNSPIPTAPNSDESKPESWLTKIGKVNKKLLAGGAILLIGLPGFFIVQSFNTTSNTTSVISPGVITTPNTTDIEGKWKSSWGDVYFKSDLTGHWAGTTNGHINRWTYNPKTRTLVLVYSHFLNETDGGQVNGSATLTLSEDGNTLEGKWTQQNKSGEWNMTRDSFQ